MADDEAPHDPIMRLTAKIATFLAALDDDERAALEQIATDDDHEVTGFATAPPTVNSFWSVMSTVLKGASDTQKSIAQNIR